jgi:hypothetical protein
MGHIFKRSFSKLSRKIANVNSSSTVKAKKYLRKLDKEGGTEIGTKKIKSSQENVECDGKCSWGIHNNNRKGKEKKNV